LTALELDVVAAFAEGGPLARSTDGLRPRPAQLDMASAVARTVDARDCLVVEAGTGVGKTFAYLVPVLLSGRRALLSTATQALQDQLFSRDIPAVSRALGVPVRAALLKGRSSYVCVQRLEQARSGARVGLRDPALAAGLEQVQRWAMASVSGDLAELPGLDEASPLRGLISSTRDNCLGGACPRLAQCHVNRARHEALRADWVVINHHLFFADQEVQEAGRDSLLPRAEVVVFDEAHQLNDAGVQFFGQSVGSSLLRDLAREVSSLGPQWARGMRPWSHLAFELEHAARQVSPLLNAAPGGGRRSRWQQQVPEGLDASGWRLAVAGVAGSLSAVQHALAQTCDAAAELVHLHQRVLRTQAMWARLTQSAAADAPEDGLVRWLEWGGGQAAAVAWRVVAAPVDSAGFFGALLGDAAEGRSWVFTSATLGHDDALSWFTQRLGLDALARVRTLRVPSPFDHSAQAALYIPHGLPEPADAAHTPALAEAVARWASVLGGRTLVLTTTLRAAHRMTEHLQMLVAEVRCAPMSVLGQGHMSKRTLLARFRAAGNLQTGAPGAILVASASFWEGVDLAGDVLQLLVIDKLPFPPPDDPLIEARVRQLEAVGQRAFAGCYLPEAAMALKQGAGRLIRSETDRGVLVIADRRLVTRSYGNALLAALPPMLRLVDEADMVSALNTLPLQVQGVPSQD
jgi:ATP-dependent DNA helicase DinG